MVVYRKNESYATETGEIVRRQTRMHKWGIPLAWVIGVGVSAPAGALASMWGGTCAAWHEYGQGRCNFMSHYTSIFLTPAPIGKSNLKMVVQYCRLLSQRF